MFNKLISSNSDLMVLIGKSLPHPILLEDLRRIGCLPDCDKVTEDIYGDYVAFISRRLFIDWLIVGIVLNGASITTGSLPDRPPFIYLADPSIVIINFANCKKTDILF